MPKRWDAARCRSIWKLVAGPPYIDDGDYREWSWSIGAIFTASPGRAASCAGCGGTIKAGEPALRAINSEGHSRPSGGWTAERRYLHPANCIDGSDQ